jgi:CheY-like chemotaxis protein
VPDIGILIIDADAASQRALENVLDSEGWRVRIVQGEAHALAELASGNWNLAIVNAAPTKVRGPLFAILRELSQAEVPQQGDGEPISKGFRALFLVPVDMARQLQPLLEREGLPYSLVPYHLNDFLEKVSELLVEAGAIAEPIRSISGFGVRKQVRRDSRFSHNARHDRMFASREDYQMTEEEMAEFERQEEDERKKREKALKDRERL